MERAFWLMGFTSGARQRSEKVSILVVVSPDRMFLQSECAQVQYPDPYQIRRVTTPE